MSFVCFVLILFAALFFAFVSSGAVQPQEDHQAVRVFSLFFHIVPSVFVRRPVFFVLTFERLRTRINKL